MRALIKQLYAELSTVPHIKEYDTDGNVLAYFEDRGEGGFYFRNVDCPHCDILVKYMMEDMRQREEKRQSKRIHSVSQ